MQRSLAKSIRIVFMGTPDFAVNSLRALVENSYNIVAVVTAPDRPSGRGQRIHSSAVKNYALSKNLTVLQPTNLKSETFQQELEALDPELQIVVAFRMLPQTVWALPKFGTFNLHASLLPDYRGAAPIHWAIINGETETGVTTFFIDEKIDTGAILLHRKTSIGIETTVGELHDRLMHLGAELVLETVNGIASGELSAAEQPKTDQPKIAPKLTKENCKINWQEDVVDVYNKIRGLNPFPSAWTFLSHGSKQLMVKLYRVNSVEEDHGEEFGNITVEKDHLKVAAKGGFILIYEIQLPGKRKMEVKALLNGFSFQAKDKMS